ncbi:hypothetical protein [Nonomuraea guangzhouensis]|uniref:Uncharacterized protein n=1 Tax=Nonomuraea guangzhouensis TaxID=1291555 RepID=A0ABW4FZC2_9ACTN|nr:hypothetical protein [Nonomuraea guangzhouensis]
MKRIPILMTAAALVLSVPAPAHATARSAPEPEHTVGELRKALLTKKDGFSGYKVHHVAAGTASRFLAGRTKQESWALSFMPSRCRSSATAGLLFDPKTVARIPDAPAAAIELWGEQTLGETLVSVPADLPDSVVRGKLPRGCGKIRATHKGKRITVRVKKLSGDALPDIPGATVSGFKTVVPTGVWGNAKPGEGNLIVVRSGALVLETYTDVFGHVDGKAAKFTVKAWERALDRLS